MSKSSHSIRLSHRGKGILMSIGGVLVLSPDSLLIRRQAVKHGQWG